MHRLVVASVAAVGLSVGLTVVASAADLGAPAPAPVYTKAPLAVPFSWTGFYIGGNVGYGWGKSDDDVSASQAATFNGGPPFWDLDATDPNKVSGVIGGAQAGYNWQVTNFLVGVEADIQGSGQQHTSTVGGLLIDPTGLFGNNPVTITDTSKLGWFGTVRGRAGFLATDRWLIYATGGLAYGDVSESGSAQPANPFAGVNNAPLAWNHSTTKVGWTAGAGVENAITRNWSWKIEYLYMDLGNVTSPVSGGNGSTFGGPGNCYGAPGGGACNGPLPHGAFGTATSNFTDSIVRVGVNYRFN